MLKEADRKPDSVPVSSRENRPMMTIPLAVALPIQSSGLPGNNGEQPSARRLTPLRVSLFGLAPGRACRASDVATTAVSSYLAISPLLLKTFYGLRLAVYFLWRFPWGHPRSPLESTLLVGVRTFLPKGLYTQPAVISRPLSFITIFCLAPLALPVTCQPRGCNTGTCYNGDM